MRSSSLLSAFRPPRTLLQFPVSSPRGRSLKRAFALFSRTRFGDPREGRGRRKGRALVHLVVTRSRRHETRRRRTEKSKRSFSLSPPSLSPTQTCHSAVAPRRGSLVIVANSKKTDIKKQGLNSIKVRIEKMKGKKKTRLARASAASAREKKNASRTLPSSLLTLLSLFFPPFSSLSFSSTKKKTNRTTSSRPTSWASPAR